MPFKHTNKLPIFNWSAEKDEWLKANRGIGFEEVVFYISQGEILDIVKNSNYPKQKIFIIKIRGYACLVPFREKKDEFFLKTIFPSRKATKKYLNSDT